ncbi:c-type cytochrome [Denitratisoma oestradiolicum]|uniref:Uncharacterized protein n=1 Tax=Denitratisoma oestradiolicum TaxID=311182 RepID=A0A6S6XWA9_9PROT|nr:cytochrome c [Denitratisoma oestradiolicum]TWO82207.1 hypothetical protein CBW56_01825 [Denitratisoma oestradiolicum]CAB1369147.1 conserved exported protein of unknown function [Denitratisoma oestradiolicum]
MKTISVLSLVASVTAALTGPSAAADTKGGPMKVVAMANMWGETPTPHFKVTGKPVSAARGQDVFMDHCAICHGLYGKGDGPRSAFFQAGVQYIADLSNADTIKGRDEQLRESVREGLRRFPEPAYVMPQFKYILSEEEIRSALAYVKTLPSKSTKH